MPSAVYPFIKRLVIEFTDDTYFEADKYAVKAMDVSYITDPINTKFPDAKPGDIVDLRDMIAERRTKVRVTITFEGETSVWGITPEGVQESLVKGNFRLTEGEGE